MVRAAPVTVFRRASVPSLARPSPGKPGSPTGLKDLTPDVVPLWGDSGDEYPTLDHRNVGGLSALPRVIRPRFAGVRLIRGTSGDPEVAEIRSIGR